jgi:hypothetical protein
MRRAPPILVDDALKAQRGGARNLRGFHEVFRCAC